MKSLMENKKYVMNDNASNRVHDFEICVWDCRFYLVDDNGNPFKNKNGMVQLYNAPNLDWSHISEYVEWENLEEADSEFE